MKILEEKYPLGSLKGQKTDGKYVNEVLFENIKILAKNIVRDMTYLIIITSSTLEVGAGKSVFAQQFSEAYLESIRQQHNIDNKLSMQNIIFKPKDLIERAFKVPKYSVIIVDEWEDYHYWSELGISLRQFFRKCRQLNLCIVLIIPNFFQLPMGYAISRSVALVDVKYAGEFDRGYFSFYNFQKKKELYVKGKKTQNYNVVSPNFTGRFTDGYVVNEEEYRTAKLNDLEEQESKGKPLTKIQIETQIKGKLFKQLMKKLPEIPVKRLADAFGVSIRATQRWRAGDTSDYEGDDGASDIINYPN